MKFPAPPLLVAAACCALVWVLDRAFPAARVATRWNDEIAVALFIAGIGLAVAGVVSFAHARTTVDPLHPDRASALVTNGVFRVTRNPMYVGMALAVAAFSTWWGTWFGIVGVVAFVAWIDRVQIPAEERALDAHFGAAFTAYRDRVRRWV